MLYFVQGCVCVLIGAFGYCVVFSGTSGVIRGTLDIHDSNVCGSFGEILKCDTFCDTV